MDNMSVTDDVAGASSAPMGAATDYGYAAGPDPADVEKNKVFAILAYLGLLFLVPLLAAKDSRFAMYHANQGLVLFLFDIACSAVMIIPFLGWIIGGAGWIARIVFMIMGIMNAANGQMKPLPLIGGIQLIK